MASPHEGQLRKYQAIIDIYSSGDIAARSSVLSQVPVFIVGMPRSGTSLVEQILATHSRVHGAGELGEIEILVDRLVNQSGGNMTYPACEKSVTVDQLDTLAEEYIEMLLAKAGREDVMRVSDKMPFNFMYLGFIKRLLPGAKIIHCVRDPMDTCLSCYFQDFHRLIPFVYDLKTLGIVYRQYQYLMAFWRDAMKIPMLEVRYEDLVYNQEKVSRQLISYCDLEWDRRCLEFYKNDRIVHTASMEQVRQPMYTKSVGRWKKYEKYLDPLKQGLDTPVC